MSVRTITWSHVPPGTQLEVSVTPANGDCSSVGNIFEDDGLVPVTQWEAGDLQPGPAVALLKAGTNTNADIRVVTGTTATTDGEVSAALVEASSGKVLDRQARPFDVATGAHDLIRIFADADPATAPARATAPAGLRRSKRSPSPGRAKKRGK